MLIKKTRQILVARRRRESKNLMLRKSGGKVLNKNVTKDYFETLT